MMVFLVDLEMLSQVTDAFCEQGNLDLGGACVVLVNPGGLDDSRLPLLVLSFFNDQILAHGSAEEIRFPG